MSWWRRRFGRDDPAPRGRHHVGPAPLSPTELTERMTGMIAAYVPGGDDPALGTDDPALGTADPPALDPTASSPTQLDPPALDPTALGTADPTALDPTQPGPAAPAGVPSQVPLLVDQGVDARSGAFPTPTRRHFSLIDDQPGGDDADDGRPGPGAADARVPQVGPTDDAVGRSCAAEGSVPPGDSDDPDPADQEPVAAGAPGTVVLGFADGSEVALAPEDSRTRPFVALTEALTDR